MALRGNEVARATFWKREATIMRRCVLVLAGVLAASSDGRADHLLFEKLGCATCHVETITIAPPGTVISGGFFTVPDALENKIIHPFSDLLLHDIETDKHDLRSSRLQNAIERHLGEARQVSERLEAMSNAEKQQLFSFLSSL
jgi:CxxC motif-containing protein (DUF1111 family)